MRRRWRAWRLRRRIKAWEAAHPGERWSTAAEYRSGPAARSLGAYEYEESAPLECFACGWSGLAGDGSRELHRELFDVSCPRCSQMLLIVSYPTIKETEREAARGNPEALRELEGIDRARRDLDRARREAGGLAPR